MAKNISTILISASKEKVWFALTDPALVKLWQYGSVLLTDWKVGSAIRFTTAWQDKVFEQWGKVLEVKENELIKYSLFAPRPDLEDKPENYFIMNYILSNENGKTKLEIIQDYNLPFYVQENPQVEENTILNYLKTVAEKGQ